MHKNILRIAQLMEQELSDADLDTSEKAEVAEMEREKDRVTDQQDTAKEITTDLSDETGKIVDRLKRVLANYPEGKGLEMLIKHFQNQQKSFEDEGELAYDIIKTAAMTGE
jgi:hypothetical protein